jgi:hypothetical protein
MSALRLRIKAASSLVFSGLMLFACGPSLAGGEGSYFYVQPDHPPAHRSFEVVAYSGPCESLFSEDYYDGFDYGGVTVDGDDVYVRFGAARSLSCDVPVREVSQVVPPLPPGAYTFHLIYQDAPPDDGVIREWEMEQLGVVVTEGPGSTFSVPTFGLLGTTLLIVLTLAGAAGAVRLADY